MSEFDLASYIDQGGLYVEDGRIWYGGVEHVPERTCGEWRGEQGSYGEEDTMELWCEHCDIELEEGWVFCPGCGAKVVGP